MNKKSSLVAVAVAFISLAIAAYFSMRGGSQPEGVAESSENKIIFTLNWYAQAELGGFIQAQEMGFFREAGLNVEIRQGNAQLNGPRLLVSGGTDFYVGSGFEAVKALEQGLPIKTVAAFFQKDPQVLISHPGQGNDTLESLKDKPIMVSATATTSYWPFLSSKFGFTENQKRPYAFNVAPFLADVSAIQQGYGTSEPYTIAQALGQKPNVFYLADYGYLPYANTLETTLENLEKRPDMVRRFVRAVVQGWQSYLEDPQPAFNAIQRLNPEMKEGLMNYGFEQMKNMGLVDSGDAATLGIGAMTDARWQAFYESLVEGKLFSGDLNIKEAYTLEFLPGKGT